MTKTDHLCLKWVCMKYILLLWRLLLFLRNSILWTNKLTFVMDESDNWQCSHTKADKCKYVYSPVTNKLKKKIIPAPWQQWLAFLSHRCSSSSLISLRSPLSQNTRVPRCVNTQRHICALLHPSGPSTHYIHTRNIDSSQLHLHLFT